MLVPPLDDVPEEPPDELLEDEPLDELDELFCSSFVRPPHAVIAVAVAKTTAARVNAGGKRT